MCCLRGYGMVFLFTFYGVALCEVDSCGPQCRGGYVCRDGDCVSACNPPCGEGEVCTSEGECVVSAPATAIVETVFVTEPVVPEAQPDQMERCELRGREFELKKRTTERVARAYVVDNTSTAGWWCYGFSLGLCFPIGGVAGAWLTARGTSPTIARVPASSEIDPAIYTIVYSEAEREARARASLGGAAVGTAITVTVFTVAMTVFSLLNSY